MKVISVPKTPRSAYNPKRKVSSLLKAQIANLEAVTRKRQGVTRASRPKTEGQASAYIADLTRQLHPEVLGAAQPAAGAAPAAVPYGAGSKERQKAKGKRQKGKGKKKKGTARAKRALGAKK